jgi:hypothetical protein
VRRSHVIVGLVLACGCGRDAYQRSSSDDRAVAPGAAMKPAITLELYARPSTISAANMDDFLLGFIVRNIGPQVIDPQLDHSELRVNGVPSHDWSMALMNSGREQKWYALPPGESVEGAWGLARMLFPQPGDYKLILTVGSVSSAVEVRVTP